MGSYYPHTPEDISEMLAVIGAENIEELYSDVPKDLSTGELNLSEGASERKVEERLNALAGKNIVYRSVMRGGGA